MNWVDRIVTVEFFVAIAAAAVFVVAYLPVFLRDRSWLGWVILLQKLVFVGFGINAVLYFTLGPDFTGRNTIRLVLFTAMPVAMWGMTWLLIKYQYLRRPEQPAAHGPAAASEARPASDQPPASRL